MSCCNFNYYEDDYTIAFNEKSDSVFSKDFSVEFTVDGVKYISVRQYIENQKALKFGDEENAMKIMRTQNPKKLKKIGKKVRGFNELTWSKYLDYYLEKCNFAKFSQNTELHEKIFNCKFKYFTYCNSNNKLSGSGMSLEDTVKALEVCNYNFPGINLYGKSLMYICRKLIENTERVRDCEIIG